MKKKIIGIIVITLFIATSLPVAGIMNGFINGKSNPITLTSKTFLVTSENGVILDQELDENNKGYTIIRVWGSDYEMGYAQAELLADYIVQIVNENKDFIGEDYDSVREIIDDAIWMPPGIEDEFDGMVDCLAVTHPSENIDELDLKVVNTLGDWAYACRTNMCWGRYVTSPIKTLSTHRLDSPAIYSSAYHHVLCVRDPDDGSPRWVNLAWPGYVLTMTGVNEFGTLLSNNDYQSSNPDFSANRMPRMVAFRYAMTFATDPDISTHLNDTFDELQNYEIMTGGFLNYYTPEGHGGVMTCNPHVSGPDFYHLRVPQEIWHHGEAMITTNAWTDGTFTPPDEDFGADAYYDNETPKTLESHWDLLASFSGTNGLHMLNMAYRAHEDMTIWAIGKVSSFEQTPRLEWEWDDLFNSNPPEAPDIDGQISGKAGTSYEYGFTSIDPNGDDIEEYIVDWGDETGDTITGPFTSGEKAFKNHTWAKKGTYVITAKAKDINGLVSSEGTLTVTMPRNRAIDNPLLRFFENHILLFRLFQLLFK